MWFALHDRAATGEGHTLQDSWPGGILHEPVRSPNRVSPQNTHKKWWGKSSCQVLFHESRQTKLPVCTVMDSIMYRCDHTCKCHSYTGDPLHQRTPHCHSFSLAAVLLRSRRLIQDIQHARMWEASGTHWRVHCQQLRTEPLTMCPYVGLLSRNLLKPFGDMKIRAKSRVVWTKHHRWALRGISPLEGR